MIDWFNSWWNEFVAWLNGYWQNFIEFMQELPIIVFTGILDALAYLIESIPAPTFTQQYGLFAAVAALPSDIQYFLSMSGMDTALGILGAGFLFRMTRKLVTLFQW